MQSPLSPPSPESLLAGRSALDLLRDFAESSALVDGRYLPWDELRHLPLPEGMSAEARWLSVWMARAAMREPLSLVDAAGRAFTLAMPGPALFHLHRIDRDATARAPAVRGVSDPAEVQRYRHEALIEEAIASSRLDGAPTARRAAAEMLANGRKPRNRGEMMIFNNHLAMERVRRLGRVAITPDGILELHRILTEGTLEDDEAPGRLRQNEEVAATPDSEGLAFLPPPAAALLPGRLERLCAFANAGGDDSLPFIHPVVRAILLHFMIGYDRPFAEGNGRVGRALFYWAMARSGYRLLEYISISQHLQRARQDYVRAWQHTVTAGNDATYFVLHQLSMVAEAVSVLGQTLARKTREHRDTARLLETSPRLRERLNSRQIALLTHALRNPGEAYRVNSYRRQYKVVYETARTDLLDLAAMDLLEKRKEGKSFVFHAPADLRERLAGPASQAVAE